jgi:hypothetical protein
VEEKGIQGSRTEGVQVTSEEEYRRAKNFGMAFGYILQFGWRHPPTEANYFRAPQLGAGNVDSVGSGETEEDDVWPEPKNLIGLIAGRSGKDSG